MIDSKRNFILQQGFPEPSGESCGAQYGSLMVQPRVVFATVIVGVVTGWAYLFLGLWLVLWWSALMPGANPIEAVYNAVRGRRPKLTPAPAPRRFSQAFGGAFALVTGLLILQNWTVAARVVEVIFVVAVGALAFGRLCLGSFIFHTIRGRGDFARRTLPWR